MAWETATSNSRSFSDCCLAGLPQFIIGSFAAFFIGGAISLVLLASKKVDLHGGIPFGPSMLLGAWLGIFAGVPIATLYLQLTGLA